MDESDDWNVDYATLLFVCGNTSTENRIQRLVLNSYLDFGVRTTTEERINSDSTRVWLVDYDLNDDVEMELVGL